MNWALWKKSFNEARWLLLACALYAAGFAVLRVIVVSEFDTNRFKALLDLIPDTFKTFTTVDFEWVISYTGRIAMTLDEPMLVGCIALWAIARGSDVVSGELSRGSMELLLAQPVTRAAVFWSQSAVTIMGVLIIVLSSWLGMWLSVQWCSVEESELKTPLQTVLEPIGQRLLKPLDFVDDTFGIENKDPTTRTVLMRDQVNSWVFWPGLLNTFCFGFFLAGFAAMFSAFDRHRWRTIGIVTGIYTVMAMVKFVGMSIQNASFCLWFTFFSFFEPEKAIERFQHGRGGMFEWLEYGRDGVLLGPGTTTNNVVLFLMGVACYWIGVRFFKRRDLPAPL